MVLTLQAGLSPAAISLLMSRAYTIFGTPGSDESRDPGFRPMTAWYR